MYIGGLRLSCLPATPDYAVVQTWHATQHHLATRVRKSHFARLRDFNCESLGRNLRH